MVNEKLPDGWEIADDELWLVFNGVRTFFLSAHKDKLVKYAHDPQLLYDTYKRHIQYDGRDKILLEYIESLKLKVQDEYTNCTKCNYLYSYGGPAVCSGCKVWSVVK